MAERQGRRALTDAQKAEVRRLLRLGLTPTVIERRTGISRQAIRTIRDAATEEARG